MPIQFFNKCLLHTNEEHHEQNQVVPALWELTAYGKTESIQIVTFECPTLCDPMDCGPPGSSVHGISQAKSNGVDCHFLLQGIFPTQGSNLCLLLDGQILYH